MPQFLDKLLAVKMPGRSRHRCGSLPSRLGYLPQCLCFLAMEGVRPGWTPLICPKTLLRMMFLGFLWLWRFVIYTFTVNTVMHLNSTPLYYDYIRVCIIEFSHLFLLNMSLSESRLRPHQLIQHYFPGGNFHYQRCTISRHTKKTYYWWCHPWYSNYIPMELLPVNSQVKISPIFAGEVPVLMT